MRVSTIYVHRRAPRQPLRVLVPHPPSVQRTHNATSTVFMCRRPAEEGSTSFQEGSDTLAQEPVAKVRRTEQEGDKKKSASPDGRLGSASVGNTRSILQGVLDFFKKDPITPFPTISLPHLSLPRPLRNIFLGSNPKSQQKQQQQLPPAEDVSEEKENIPPEGHSHPLATVILQASRPGESLKRGRKETDQPPPRIPSRQESRPPLPNAFATTSLGEVYKAVGKAKRPPTLRRSGPEDGLDPIRVSYKQFFWFTQLTESPEVLKFLKRDICYRYADKYLLAMVFTYFVRASLTREHYNKEYFYAALYLAHDMEEDEEELKYEVFPWALGPRWRKTYPSLLQVRDDLFWTIHCRAVVSKRGCDQVMRLQPDSWLWQRERPTYHGGARREYLRDPTDNGRPRGPEKSPIQCQLCLERECALSENSYLLYLSDLSSSGDTPCLETSVTTKQKDRDSGFETFLFEPCGDVNSLISPVDPTLKRTVTKLRLEVKH